MKAVWLDESSIYYLEGETNAEQKFLDQCPKDWTWNQVYLEWRKQGGTIHTTEEVY